MTRSRWILIALLALFSLAACNTVAGVGKDIKAAGGAIEGAGKGGGH